jgi:hypothetical protein
MIAMTLKTPICVPCLPLVLWLIGSAACAQAADPENEFKSAYAVAVASEKGAGQLRNRWTVTELALADARKAAATGDFDKAIALAREAERLARASIFQATSEREAWKDLEIR